jgi:hypothetical protein
LARVDCSSKLSSRKFKPVTCIFTLPLLRATVVVTVVGVVVKGGAVVSVTAVVADAVVSVVVTSGVSVTAVVTSGVSVTAVVTIVAAVVSGGVVAAVVTTVAGAVDDVSSIGYSVDAGVNVTEVVITPTSSSAKITAA